MSNFDITLHYGLNYKYMNLGANGDSTSSPSEEFKGSIDDLIIFNRTISAEEVFGLYNSSNVFFTKIFGISICLGTASECPVCGLHHKEWDLPSRLR